jgi:hypothetical protein
LRSNACCDRLLLRRPLEVGGLRSFPAFEPHAQLPCALVGGGGRALNLWMGRKRVPAGFLICKTLLPVPSKFALRLYGRADRIGESLAASIGRHGCCTAGSGSLGSCSVAVVPTSFLTPLAAGLRVTTFVETDDVVASWCLTSAGRDAPCHLKVHSSQQGMKAPT